MFAVLGTYAQARIADAQLVAYKPVDRIYVDDQRAVDSDKDIGRQYGFDTG